MCRCDTGIRSADSSALWSAGSARCGYSRTVPALLLRLLKRLIVGGHDRLRQLMAQVGGHGVADLAELRLAFCVLVLIEGHGDVIAAVLRLVYSHAVNREHSADSHAGISLDLAFLVGDEAFNFCPYHRSLRILCALNILFRRCLRLFLVFCHLSFFSF